MINKVPLKQRTGTQSHEGEHLPSEAAVTLPEAGFPPFMNKEKNDEVRLRFLEHGSGPREITAEGPRGAGVRENEVQ